MSDFYKKLRDQLESSNSKNYHDRADYLVAVVDLISSHRHLEIPAIYWEIFGGKSPTELKSFLSQELILSLSHVLADDSSTASVRQFALCALVAVGGIDPDELASYLETEDLEVKLQALHQFFKNDQCDDPLFLKHFMSLVDDASCQLLIASRLVRLGDKLGVSYMRSIYSDSSKSQFEAASQITKEKAHLLAMANLCYSRCPDSIRDALEFFRHWDELPQSTKQSAFITFQGIYKATHELDDTYPEAIIRNLESLS